MVFSKFRIRQFLTIKTLKLHVKFQKNFTNQFSTKTDTWPTEQLTYWYHDLLTYWHTDILNYWHIDRGSFIGPFPPKGRGPKIGLSFSYKQKYAELQGPVICCYYTRCIQEAMGVRLRINPSSIFNCQLWSYQSKN